MAKRRFGLPLEMRIRECRLDEWNARRFGQFDLADRLRQHGDRLEALMGGRFSFLSGKNRGPLVPASNGATRQETEG